MESFKSVTSEKAGGREPERKNIASSALKTSTTIECGFCQQNHLTEKFRMVLQLPVRERQARTKDAGLCFRCLQPSHLARSCSARCRICQGRHHQLNCYGDPDIDQIVEKNVDINSSGNFNSIHATEVSQVTVAPTSQTVPYS